MRGRTCGAIVDVHVADAVEVLDHRHARFTRDAFDEALAAARHDRVDVLVHNDELAHRCTIGRCDELHRVLGEVRGLEPDVKARGDPLVRIQRFAATSKNAGVARLEA